MNRHVRFTPESGHVQCKRLCLLWAKSGLMHRSKQHFYGRFIGTSCFSTVGVGGSAQGQLFFAVPTHLANMVLCVQLKAKLGNKVELGFEEIYVVLLVRHQLFEQIARHIILD